MSAAFAAAAASLKVRATAMATCRMSAAFAVAAASMIVPTIPLVLCEFCFDGLHAIPYVLSALIYICVLGGALENAGMQNHILISLCTGECDCDGNVNDCAGVCGGFAVEDECGGCDGDGIASGKCCDWRVQRVCLHTQK
jgi:hypothetical protein